MKPKRLLIGSMAVFVFISTLFVCISLYAKAPSRQFYQLIVYQIKDKAQEKRMDSYLAEAYIPAAHRLGIKTVGVFKTANIDTASNKYIYVLLTYQSLKDFHKIRQELKDDKELAEKGREYLDAAYNDAPYLRMESILMEAFSSRPTLRKPEFSEPAAKRVYELRSYESATEKLGLNKIQMFNKEEVDIFDHIGSQPVFYGEVLSGSRMPNLMYMTTYSSMESREEHWKAFFSDPAWKRASTSPEYQHNTSKAIVYFLVPTEYSDI